MARKPYRNSSTFALAVLSGQDRCLQLFAQRREGKLVIPLGEDIVAATPRLCRYYMGRTNKLQAMHKLGAGARAESNRRM
jgi:hypothetical protein